MVCIRRRRVVCGDDVEAVLNLRVGGCGGFDVLLALTMRH
jgi:hypothetical protein